MLQQPAKNGNQLDKLVTYYKIRVQLIQIKLTMTSHASFAMMSFKNFI